MILQIHGPKGWAEKIAGLMQETDALCQVLDDLNIRYFRNPQMNIISIRAGHFPESISEKYRLVSDNYEGKAKWWKIVVMPHTKGKVIKSFIQDLKALNT